MHRYGFHGKWLGIAIIVAFLVFIIMVSRIRFSAPPEDTPPQPDTRQAEIEATRKAGYDEGYTNGYNTAKAEASTAYKQGYATAQKEVSRDAFTRGFFVGVFVSIAGFAVIMRKSLSKQIKTIRKKYQLRKAFNTIPADLAPDVYTIAEQIARAYTDITEQLCSTKGHLIEKYTQRWRPKFDELMTKAVQLMERIQELDAARATVNEQRLIQTIDELHQTVQTATEDDIYNEAAKSLKRSEQALKDLQNTKTTREYYKTRLKGITSMLESMHLKLSQMKVHTQTTEALDQLSSDLEIEISALEDALSELVHIPHATSAHID